MLGVNVCVLVCVRVWVVVAEYACAGEMLLLLLATMIRMLIMLGC